MLRWSAVLVCWLALLGWPGAALAATLGQVTYTPPKHWTTQPAQSFHTVSPPASAGANTFVLVYDGSAVAGQAMGDLMQEWAALLPDLLPEDDQLQRLSQDTPQVGQLSPETELGLMTLQVRLRGAAGVLQLAVVRQGEWAAPVLLFGPSEASLQPLLPDFLTLLKSVKLRPPPPPAANSPAALMAGTWVHSRAGVLLPTISGGLSSECPGNICWELRSFAPLGNGVAGYFSDQIPQGSLDEVNCAQASNRDAGVCKIYLLQGGTLEVPGATPVSVQWRGSVLVLDDREYRRLPSLKGVRLEGTYEGPTFQANLTDAGGAAQHVTFVFSRDGRFTLDGSSSFGLTAGGVSASGGSRLGTQQGRYQFSDHALTLTFSDGRVVNLVALSAVDDDGTPILTSLNLGGRSYYRKTGR